MRLDRGSHVAVSDAAVTKNSGQHVELLDFIRGVAILAVLVFHTLGLTFGHDSLPWSGWWRDFSGSFSFLCFLPVALLGQAGVAIFFVVSGFCIHVSFQRQGRQWGAFFTRRFFRIYPPYLLALAFSVMILVINTELDLSNPEFWLQLSSHVFLVHNFDPDTIYGFNASLWSLAVEAQLYLLYPVLLAVVARTGWRRAMILLAACEVTFRGTHGVVQTMDAENSFSGRLSWVLANSPLGYWFSWALGAFIAEAWLKREPLPWSKTSPLWFLGMAFICYFVKPLSDLQFLLFAMTTAVFAGNFLGGLRLEGRIPAISVRWVTKAGLWSYSIYLLHQPLLHVLSRVVAWGIPDADRPAPVAFLLMTATWLLIIPFSVWWYAMIEIPSIALGKKFAGRKTPGTESAPGAGAGGTRVRHGLMIAGLLIGVTASLLITYRFSDRVAVNDNNRAWELATSADPAKRNGARAVELAEDACVQTHYQQAVMVGTLAAAYAEAGRFDEAIGAAQMACAMAEKAGDAKLLAKNKEMLGRFLQRQPYHEPPPAAGANGTNFHF